MKYLSSIIFIFLFFNNLCYAETIIKGSILNAEDGEFGYYFNEPILGTSQFATVKLYNDSFELRYDILDPILFSVFANDNQIEFYIMPNDVFTFSVDMNNVSNTLQYQCKNMEDQRYTTGLSAIESLKYLAMKPYKIKGTGWGDMPNGFVDSLDKSVLQKKKAFKKLNNESIGLSNELITNVIDTCYNTLLKDITTISLSQSKNVKLAPGTKIPNEKTYQKQIQHLGFLRTDLIRNDKYMQFLYWNESLAYDKWIIKKNGVFDRKFWEDNRIDFQNQYYTNDTVKYAIMAYVNGYNNARNPDLYGRNLRKIESLFPNGVYNSKMQQIENTIITLKQGAVAPNFTLKDLNGNDVSLSDFKGKVVYIDFWASWCMPCIMENKQAKSIKSAFKDVVFLYITRDINETVWKEAIKKQEIEGIHLMGGGDKVFDVYKAQGVPTYVLIGKDGKIINANAPRPSAKEELILLFNKALQD